MKKLLCVALATMMLLLAVAPACAASIRGINPGDKLYVNSAAGRALNLRKEPSTSAKIIAKLSRGTVVIAGEDYEDPYLKVTVNGKSGWVDIRYLSESKPSSGGGGGTSTGTLVSKLSFKSFVPVTNVVVVTPVPSRVGGSVNLRWAPSTEASVLRRVYAGDLLQVVTEGKDWYQVKTDDGYVVFIAKKFATVVYNGDEAGYEALVNGTTESK